MRYDSDRGNSIYFIRYSNAIENNFYHSIFLTWNVTLNCSYCSFANNIFRVWFAYVSSLNDIMYFSNCNLPELRYTNQEGKYTNLIVVDEKNDFENDLTYESIIVYKYDDICKTFRNSVLITDRIFLLSLQVFITM